MEGRIFDAVVDCIMYEPVELDIAVELFGGQVSRYVFISSQAAYDMPSDRYPIDETCPLIGSESRFAYAAKKADIERKLETIGHSAMFPWVSLRPGYIYGPYNNAPQAEFSLFARIEQGRPVLVPNDGMAVVHHTHGRDLAEAVLAALTHDRAVGRAYNIVGDYAQTHNRLVRAVAQAVGSEPKIVHVPNTTPAQARRFFFYLINPMLILSIERAKRELAWAPQFDIENGMADSYRWYRESGYADTFAPDFSADDETLASVGAY
jgi:nucleoside-diphosphate-sugar epimerase